MRVAHIVPVNDLIDGTKCTNSSFNLTKESFDFPVGLGMFHGGNDVFDPVLIQEFLERVTSMFPVASGNELSSVVCQDLAGSAVLSKSLLKNRRVFSVVRGSNTP